MRRLAGDFCVLLCTVLAAASARSQTEVEPLKVPVVGTEPTLYWSGGGVVTEWAKYYADMREEWRKKKWPEEAERMGRPMLEIAIPVKQASEE